MILINYEIEGRTAREKKEYSSVACIVQGHLRKSIADPAIGAVRANNKAMVQEMGGYQNLSSQGHASSDNGQLLSSLVGVNNDPTRQWGNDRADLPFLLQDKESSHD